MSLAELRGKVALVTGASGGIGAAARPASIPGSAAYLPALSLARGDGHHPAGPMS